ncbi:MAG: hypothetical protein RR667_05690, partial [Muribaculaceae bacterium]
MKNYRKLVLLVLGASIFGSALTIMATTALRQDDEICGNNATQSDNFIRTSQVATRNPDFTVAAESTINAVVSIKSFVTPRQRQSMQGGFMDPFEFFFGPGFGGGNGQSTPQQPQQQQKPQQSGLGSGV